MAPEDPLKGKKITVLGCGWVGFPLAKRLMAAGAIVNGTTTSIAKLQQLRNTGINDFLLDISQPPASWKNLDRLLNTQALVIALPPWPGAAGGTFLTQLHSLLQAAAASEVSQVLYTSSTGVYPDSIGMASEADAQGHSPRAQLLLDAENLVRSQPGIAAAIVRFGGLFGPGRHPGRFLAGKTGVANGASPVNMLHQDDAVQLLLGIIRKNAWGQVYNAVADEHPTREEFYTLAAQLARLPPPQFSGANVANPTLVDNAKVKRELGYRFLQPDPLKALQDLMNISK